MLAYKNIADILISALSAIIPQPSSLSHLPHIPLPEITEVAIIAVSVIKHLVPAAVVLCKVGVFPLQYEKEEIDVTLHVCTHVRTALDLEEHLA